MATNGLLRARALGVDGPRHQLLARPALAHDEDGGRGRRHVGHRLVDGEHRRRGPHDLRHRLRVGPRGRRLLGLGQLSPLDGLAHHALQLRRLDGLGQVVVGALTHRGHRALDVGVRRHQDDRRGRAGFADAPQHVVPAVLVGEVDVRQHDVVAGQPGRRRRRPRRCRACRPGSPRCAEPARAGRRACRRPRREGCARPRPPPRPPACSSRRRSLRFPVVAGLPSLHPPLRDMLPHADSSDRPPPRHPVQSGGPRGVLECSLFTSDAVHEPGL